MLLALLIATIPQIPLFSDLRLSEALGGFRPKPGAWVEYAVLPRGGPQARVKASVLPADLPEGRYWLEIVSEAQGGVPVAVKMLLRGAPERLDNVERMAFYVAGQAPIELPIEDVQRTAAAPSEKLPKARRAGSEQLSLRLGRFRCEVLQVADARLYRSAQVPLWGMVRTLGRDQRVELVAFGESGAVSVFPEAFDQGKGRESVK